MKTTTVLIDKAGRVVIPKWVREGANLQAGDGLKITLGMLITFRGSPQTKFARVSWLPDWKNSQYGSMVKQKRAKSNLKRLEHQLTVSGEVAIIRGLGLPLLR